MATPLHLAAFWAAPSCLAVGAVQCEGFNCVFVSLQVLLLLLLLVNIYLIALIFELPVHCDRVKYVESGVEVE